MQVTMPSDIETNVVNDVAATPVRCGGLIDIEQRLQNGELGGSSNWEDIENKPATFPPSAHSHDDLYYTESEVNNLLNSKLDSNGNASNLVSTFTQTTNFENLTSGESLSVSLGKIMKAIEVIDSKADKIAVYSEDASQIVKEIDLGFKMLEEEGNVTKGQLIDRDTMGALYPETTWERIIDKPNMSDYYTKNELNTNYYTKTETDNKLSTSYYTKTETDTKLNTKANSSHTHTTSQISNFPTSMKNPTSITVQLNGGSTEGTNKFTYDGSTAKSINVTPSAIGAYTKSEVDNLIDSVDVPMDSILNTVYPVGSIYTSVNSTDPSTLFGGTWERFGKGKVLVGVDEDDSDFSEANKTGGEKTHTLTTNEMPSHTHTQNSHTHTIGSHTHSVPAHSHGLNSHTHSFSDTTSSAGSHTHSVSGTAASAGSHVHNLELYRCDREASGYGAYGGDGRGFNNRLMVSAPANTYDIASAGTHTHRVSGTAASAGSHTHTVSGTTGAASGSTANSSALISGSATPTCSSTTATNNNTGGSGSHNNLQPFITVFIWVRTA